MKYEKHMELYETEDLQADIEIIKDFDYLHEKIETNKYLIDKTEIDTNDDYANNIINSLSIYYFKDIFIITIERSINYLDSNTFVYYHTLRSIKYLSWTEESLCYQIEEYIEKITEQPEIKDKIEKIKLSQKLKNF